MENDPTKRFSTRVENYVRYRPTYPRAILEPLREVCGLTPETLVADIGSGTGALTRVFLENGNQVFAVEPNAEMRQAGERLLAAFPRFISIDGRAEATTLAAFAVEMITAGQAFHWFAQEPTRREWQRILRPGGWVVLVWNERLAGASPFAREYEALLARWADDYARVQHRQVDDAQITQFLGGVVQHFAFANPQSVDFAGLRGRLLSSSYAPEPGDPRHDPMMAELAEVFARYAQAGRVQFDYETRIYVGR